MRAQNVHDREKRGESVKIIKKAADSFIKWFDYIPTWFLSYLSLVVSMIAFVVVILLKK